MIDPIAIAAIASPLMTQPAGAAAATASAPPSNVPLSIRRTDTATFSPEAMRMLEEATASAQQAEEDG